jgi:hypothetical protein
MIKEITSEIDKSIQLKADNPKLSELVVSVIAKPQDVEKDFLDMCYEIHEFETDTTSDSEEATKYHLKTYEDFSSFLASLKEKNLKFWETKV